MRENYQPLAQTAADKHWSHLSGVGLGKSHLMTALGYAACQRGHSVLFTGAIDIINTLATAHAAGGLKRALAAYVKPEVLRIDELGYLPIDKFGADCLFQVISHRYEHGAGVPAKPKSPQGRQKARPDPQAAGLGKRQDLSLKPP